MNLKNDKVIIPGEQIPSFKISEAMNRGASDNWLFYCWGGLGDQVCSEPTIRWAYQNLPWKRFGIVTDCPALFSHIPCEKFPLEKRQQLEASGKWYLCPTIFSPPHLTWEFFSHMLVHSIDYVSINCLRMMLPVADREIKLVAPSDLKNQFQTSIDIPWERAVVIHPGKHWPSKTFPPEFWSMVVDTAISQNLFPIIIGKKVDENVGYVDFPWAASRGLDTRDKLSLGELIFLLQKAPCLVSNDSSAIHIAASGKAEIGCIATVKHPDYIKHWRDGIWGKGFTNLSKGGLWQKYSISPFVEKTITCEEIEADYLLSILPTREEIASYLQRVFQK